MNREHAIPPQRLSDLLHKRIPPEAIGYEAAWTAPQQEPDFEIVMFEPDDALHWTEIVVYALLVVFVGGLALWGVRQLAPFIL